MLGSYTRVFTVYQISFNQNKLPRGSDVSAVLPSYFRHPKYTKTSSNQRLWKCVRHRINFYTDTLNDFPSWLSTLKNQPFFVNNRGFTERYFSDKVHAILIEEVPVYTTLCDGASFRSLASLKGLKYLHQPSNFVLNILTLTCTL